MPEKDSIIKEQKSYRNLRNQYAEALDHIQELEDDQRYWSKELQYLNNYIHYKGLDDDYQYFVIADVLLPKATELACQ